MVLPEPDQDQYQPVYEWKKWTIESKVGLDSNSVSQKRNLKVDIIQDNWKIASLTLGFVGVEVASRLE